MIFILLFLKNCLYYATIHDFSVSYVVYIRKFQVLSYQILKTTWQKMMKTLKLVQITKLPKVVALKSSLKLKKKVVSKKKGL